MPPTVIVNAAASATAIARVELRSNMMILPAFQIFFLIANAATFTQQQIGVDEPSHRPCTAAIGATPVAAEGRTKNSFEPRDHVNANQTTISRNARAGNRELHPLSGWA